MNINIDLTQITLISTFLLCTAIIATYLFRNRSAAFRHSIMAWTMFSLVLLPLVTPFLPPLYTGSTSDASALGLAFDKTIESITDKKPEKTEYVPASMALVKQADSPFSAMFKKAEPAGNVVVARFGDLTISRHSTGHYILLAVLLTFMMCWGTVVILRLLGVIISYVSLRKWVRKGTQINDQEAISLLQSVAKRYGTKRKIHLLENPAALVPFSIVLNKTYLFLPSDWSTWPREKLEAVFKHELAHVVRHDFFWLFISRLASVFYWFNPLYWYVAYNMKQEQEIACDNSVLAQNENAQDYADILLEMASELKNKRQSQAVPKHAVTMACQNNKLINHRVHCILDSKIDRKPLTAVTSLLLLFLFASIVYAASIITRKPTDAERIFPFAICKSDIESVTLSGKVLMPDGSPAKKSYFCLAETVYYAPKYSFVHSSNGHQQGSWSEQTGEDGTFKFKATAGSNAFIIAGTSETINSRAHVIYGDHDRPKMYVSPPLSLSPQENNNEEIVLQLEEATLLTGKILYANGEPAAQESVGVVQYVKPVHGANIPSVQNMSYIKYDVTTTSSGRFTFPLWAGNFTVFTGGTPWSEPITQNVTLEKGKTEYIEFIFPTTLSVRFEKEDGSEIDGLNVKHLVQYVPSWSKSSSHPIDTEIIDIFDSSYDTIVRGEKQKLPDSFMINLCPKDNYIVAITNDNEYGIMQRIDSGMMDKEHTIKLLPTVSGTAKLTDATGKPLRNQEVSIMLRNMAVERNGDFSMKDTSLSKCTTINTDKDGVLEFKVPIQSDNSKGVTFFFEKGDQNGCGGLTYRPGNWFISNTYWKKYNGFSPPTTSKSLDLGEMQVESHISYDTKTN
ncbi:MAG: M56 family metallopeptidase [Thermoguttaceae bacterium]